MQIEEVITPKLECASLDEVAVRRVRVVRHGHVIRKSTCPPGYRLHNGVCVRQSSKERRHRHKGAVKGNRRGRAARIRMRMKSIRVRHRRHLD